VRRAPQVMVKVTGGGRGMKAIAAHLRYISKNGRLEIEDERGQTMRGKDALRELADDWRYGGSLIEDTSPRREAFNIMLSMPRGTDPASVRWAAREFAKTELADHKFVMVLHDHQANPHVHISVRAESKHGRRLNPRKTDLHRWRETFAAKLQERGIDAEATRQATRGATRIQPDLWRVKAAEDGRLLQPRAAHRRGVSAATSRREARQAWHAIAQALSGSVVAADRLLATSIAAFANDQTREPHAPRAHTEPRPAPQPQQVQEKGRSR
jgi:Relaxase/Mobilisation nuclease domain